ncbi:hypothetical protein HZS_4172 [Henneguya salminicola]|nr:hypothetical protein HZS_4172 [Henneguya salminicola]
MTLLTVYILCLLFCTNFCDLLKFESAQRDIYLNSHKINAKYDIVVKNYGNSPEEVLEFIFNHQICSKIYFISATQDGSNTLLTKHASTNTSKYCYFRINLLEKIEPNSESTISLKIVFGRRLSPFPKETTQTEEQSFLFYDDFFIDTIYEVITQMTNIHIDKPQLLSISDDPMRP